MPAIRTCNPDATIPKTPRRTRISVNIGSSVDRTQPNTPESPTLHTQKGRALRRDPSMILSQSMTLHYRSVPFSQTVHDPGSLAENSDSENIHEFVDVPSATHDPLSYAAAHSINKQVEDHKPSTLSAMTSPVSGGTERSVNDIDPATIQTFLPLSSPTPQSETYLLLQLDCFSGAGLSEEQFLRLVVKCHVCRRYMTSSTIEYHDCKGARV